VQPPPSPDSLNEPLYEAFYGLREQPFTLTTDPRFLYLSPGHRQAFDELLTGLRRHEGILLLTGDTGTGKTTLCRAVIDALGHRSFAALILNPYMSDIEVLRTILRDFGLVTREDIRKGAFDHADAPQLLDTLEAFLRSLVALNSYAVVIIDEAQSLSPKVLDQIRVLGSIEQDGRRLLQIVLVGQPALIETLRADSMRALADRVSRRTSLGPLPERDVDAYIRHRLTIAGGKDAVTFDAEALARITDLSDGLPRRINLLCDRALELGRVAGVTTITAPLVSRAAKAIAGIVSTPPESPAHAPRAAAPRPAAPRAIEPASELGNLDEPAANRPVDDEPLGDDMFKDLELGPANGIDSSFERPLELLIDTPPKKFAWGFWILLVVLAGGTAAAMYFAVRNGWIKL
jgi:general secretion pathway protein A